MKKIILALSAVILIVSVAFPALASTYLANTKSGKFHLYSCSTIKYHDAEYFIPYESRQACVDDGYIPCKKCHP